MFCWRKILDKQCKFFAQHVKEEIVLADGVVFYQSGPWATFGINEANYRNHTNDFEGTTICQGENATSSSCVSRFFSPVNGPVKYYDNNGFDVMYKIICIDIDGIPDGVNSVNCKNECPFGYALRADGKILAGTRAQEWLERDTSQNN